LVAVLKLCLLGSLTVRISFISTILGSFTSSGFPLKFFKSLTYLFLYIFFLRLFLGHRSWAFAPDLGSSGSGCSRSRGAFNVLTDPLALFPLFFFGISSCFLIVFLLDRLLELGKIYLFSGEIRPAKFLIFGGNGRILLLSCLRGGFRWF